MDKSKFKFHKKSLIYIFSFLSLKRMKNGRIVGVQLWLLRIGMGHTSIDLNNIPVKSVHHKSGSRSPWGEAG